MTSRVSRARLTLPSAMLDEASGGGTILPALHTNVFEVVESLEGSAEGKSESQSLGQD